MTTIIRSKLTNELYSATLGTEFNPSWWSAMPLYMEIGPRVALSPDTVEVIISSRSSSYDCECGGQSFYAKIKTPPET